MTHVTCRLTAKNRDQLRKPTLGNRVWATFTCFYLYMRNRRTDTTDCSTSPAGDQTTVGKVRAAGDAAGDAAC